MSARALSTIPVYRLERWSGRDGDRRTPASFALWLTMVLSRRFIESRASSAWKIDYAGRPSVGSEEADEGDRLTVHQNYQRYHAVRNSGISAGLHLGTGPAVRSALA